MEKKVLITGLFTQAGLFAVRKFGELGYHVTAADNHRLAFGMYSKYVKKRVKLPSLRKTPHNYARALLNELKTGNYDYYFPSFEEAFLLSIYKTELDKYVKHTVAPYHEIMRLHDKGVLKNVVENAGGYYPKTFVPSSMDEVDEIIKKIDYPVYIKIRRSQNATGLRLVEDPTKIEEAYLDVMKRNGLDENSLPMIQQKIKGPEVCMSGLSFGGKTIAKVAYVGVRSIPRSGGTTVCRKTVQHKLCEEESEKIIKQIEWTGFFGIDFIIDERTNKPYAVDFNPRPSVSLNVGGYSGVDMIPEWIKIADNQIPNILPKAKENVKSATNFADIVWFIETFFNGPESWSERKKLRKEWIADRKHIIDDILKWNDFIPTVVLNIFLVIQATKLLFTNLEASMLFLYYNSFGEDTFNMYEQIHEVDEIHETINTLKESEAISV